MVTMEATYCRRNKVFSDRHDQLRAIVDAFVAVILIIYLPPKIWQAMAGSRGSSCDGAVTLSSPVEPLFHIRLVHT